jgi:hypothetical protein
MVFWNPFCHVLFLSWIPFSQLSPIHRSQNQPISDCTNWNINYAFCTWLLYGEHKKSWFNFGFLSCITLHITFMYLLFHSNENQAFSCRMIPSCIFAIANSQIRSDLKIHVEITTFFHRWELFVKLLSTEYWSYSHLGFKLKVHMTWIWLFSWMKELFKL